VMLACFFLSLSRRPPPLPLFPYTTLFRSRSNDLAELLACLEMIQDERHHAIDVAHQFRRDEDGALVECAAQYPLSFAAPCDNLRSEEHTSELQSRENLVCRLLLEKKNKCK